tara:strand:+ start:323 stop:2254 length:1932 start_codon:yes stop_codon:yes gene_type:complete
MSFMIALAQVLACGGFGLIALRALQIESFPSTFARFAWAGVLGIGILGWLLFGLGMMKMLNGTALGLTLAIGACGLVFIRSPKHKKANSVDHSWPVSPTLNSVGLILIAAIAIVFSLDVFEALAPVTDADSLAYHYAIPKQFLSAGEIVFIPRAVDGAVPLLLQMTYLPVLALGGTKALTLWAMFSAYMTVALLFVVARQCVRSNWALVLVLLVISTPAVIYGAGNGQVEVRNAAFVLAGAMALSYGIKQENLRWIIVAGIAAGFFVAAKYSGLFYLAALGLTLLAFKPNIRFVIAFSLAALIAGGQWYAWNWVNTGDPVFPALFGLVPYVDPALWTQEIQDYLEYRLKTGENALPKTLPWALAYPFIATFGNNPILQGGHVGFGVAIFVLALPAAFAAFSYRHHIRRHRLLPVATMALIYYVLWYFFGPSQRTRHFLVLYPLALMLIMFVATKWASSPFRKRVLGLVLVPVIGMQIAAQGIYTSDAIRFQRQDMFEITYLRQNVSDFAAVTWINENLPENAHVLSQFRQLEFYMIPKMYFLDVDQTLINALNPTQAPGVFWQQIRTQKITHALALNEPGPRGSGVNASFEIWAYLMKRGCVQTIHQMPSTAIASRALNITSPTPKNAVIMQLTPTSCDYDNS